MKRLILTLTLLHTIAAFGQLSGKYSSYSKTKEHYIFLISDSSFEYHYQYDIFGDHLKGTYTVKGKTIKFKYIKNASDSILNSLPPDSLFLGGDTLYEYSNGKVKRKSDRYLIEYKPNRAERQNFRRKNLFFGPYVSKRRSIYYMRKVENSPSIDR